MILVIDIGNTTIAFTGMARKTDSPADFAPEKNGAGSQPSGNETEARNSDALPDFDILFEKKLPTDSGRDVPRFVEEAQKLLEGVIPLGPADHDCAEGTQTQADKSASFPALSLIAISSVVPDCTPAAAALAERICAVPPVLISNSCNTGINFERIGAPETIGADRLADIVWAAEGYPLPAMTVDLGTATTINVINVLPGDDRPAFLGGMIAAGVRTSLRALRALTAQLPALEPDVVTEEEFIGTDTRTNMLSAAVVGTAAMIEGMADRVEEQLGAPVTLILTGGNAYVTMPWMRRTFIHEPALAAKGAAAIALRETGSWKA